MAERVDHAQALSSMESARTPAGVARSSLSTSETTSRPGDAHDAIVAHEAEEPLARPRAVEQVVGQLFLAGAGRLGRARVAEHALERAAQVGDARAGRAGEAEHVRRRVLVARHDGVRRQLVARRPRRRTPRTSASPSASSIRSSLLSTTICGRSARPPPCAASSAWIAA